MGTINFVGVWLIYGCTHVASLQVFRTNEQKGDKEEEDYKEVINYAQIDAIEL